MTARTVRLAICAAVITALCAGLARCGSVSGDSSTVTMTQAVASATLAEAALVALGALNDAGMLTPEQYDRAVDLSTEVAGLAHWIADNPKDPQAPVQLVAMRQAANGLKRLAEEVRAGGTNGH